MITTATYNIAAGSTVYDLYSQWGGSASGAETPPHEVHIQNNGTGTLRVGKPTDISTTLGWKVGPGEEFHLKVGQGDRLGTCCDSGTACPDITVILQTGV